MSFFELVKKRRSIRKFKQEKIEPEAIKQILFASLMAPSSRNTKPLEFIVVENKEMLQKLSESRNASSQLIANASAAIVVCVDKIRSACAVEDASISATIMQLQAEDLNLGSCWVQIHNREKEPGKSSENYIKQLLDINNNNLDIVCIIAIGKKDEEKPSHNVDNIDLNKIHYEKYH